MNKTAWMAAATLATTMALGGCASGGGGGGWFGSGWFGGGSSARASGAAGSGTMASGTAGGRMSNAGLAASVRGPGDMSDYPASAGSPTVR